MSATTNVDLLDMEAEFATIDDLWKQDASDLETIEEEAGLAS